MNKLAVFGVLVFLTSAAVAQQVSKSSFDEMLTNFQQYPGNLELQKKIIEAAREQKPYPRVPEEARRLVESANAKLDGQPTNERKRSAAADLLRAVSLAPWWGNASFNLGFAYERLDQKAMAGRMYAIYILTEPSPLEIDETRTRINKLADEENTMFEKTKLKRVSADSLLDALEGAVYDCGKDSQYYFRIAIRSRFPASERIEHTAPKPVNGLMPLMFPVPGPAVDRNGLTFTGLGSTGYVRTVSPDVVFTTYRGGSTRTCNRIRTF